MPCEPPDKHFFAEITDLNLGFLRLAADPRAGSAGRELIGLAEESAAALQVLAPAELEQLARTPTLLAGIVDGPAAGSVAEAGPAAGVLNPAWSGAARLYATGLLTYLWQLARHQPVAAALCIGPEPARVQALAGMSCADVLNRTVALEHRLRARRILRAPYLSHLLQVIRGGATDCGRPGLDLIALGLAKLKPAIARRNLL